MRKESSLSSTSKPTFEKNVAREVVKNIDNNVDVMIRDSKLIDRKYHLKDKQFGLFSKTELQLGKLLGSGGYCQVYEIKGFKCSSEKTIKIT